MGKSVTPRYRSDLLSIEEKRALCNRIAMGKASTVDFLKRMGLNMEAFLNYAQMSDVKRVEVADAMASHWGIGDYL